MNSCPNRAVATFVATTLGTLFEPTNIRKSIVYGMQETVCRHHNWCCPLYFIKHGKTSPDFIEVGDNDVKINGFNALNVAKKVATKLETRAVCCTSSQKPAGRTIRAQWRSRVMDEGYPVKEWKRRDSGDEDEPDEAKVPQPLTRQELKNLLLRDRSVKEHGNGITKK